jgi:hypothetical protein
MTSGGHPALITMWCWGATVTAAGERSSTWPATRPTGRADGATARTVRTRLGWLG